MAFNAGGFVKGFAEGFTSERNRRLDREAQKEDLDFKYRMEELIKRRSVRDEQRAKEDQWKVQAESAAKRAGDPTFASVAYQQFQAGRDIEDVYKDIDSGYWTKDKNAELQKSQTFTYPSSPGHDGEAAGTVKAQAPSRAQVEVETETVAPRRKAPLLERIEADKAAKRKSNVDKRIEDLDPSLLAADEPSKPAYEAVDADGWSYKNTDLVKLPSYEQVQYNLIQAEQSRNTPEILKAKDQERAWHIKLNRDAKAKAMAEQRKDIKQFAYLDPKSGQIKSMITTYMDTDEEGNPITRNAATNEIVTAEQGQMVPVTEKLMQDYEGLAKDFGSKSDKYDIAVNEYTGYLTVVKEIDTLFQQDPGIASSSYGVLEAVRSLQAEVKAAGSIITDNMGNQRPDPARTLDLYQQSQRIAEGARTGKTGEISGQVADFEEKINGILSQPNRDRAQNKVLYESLRTIAAIKAAAANGIDGRNMSDKDFQRIYDATSKSNDRDAVMNQLLQTGRSTFGTLQSAQIQLDNNQQVKAFETRAGFKTGLNGVRVGDRLEQMGRSDLRTFFDDFIYKPWKNGTAGAVYNSRDIDNPGILDELSTSKPVRSPGQVGPSQKDIGILTKNPTPKMREFFDQTYGAGSAKRILGE